MNRRRNVIIVAVLGIVFMLFIFLGFRAFEAGNAYNQDLQYTYTKSLGQFTEYLSKTVNALDKSKYCQTVSGHLSIAMQIMESGTGAKVAMSYLPFSENSSETVETHISTAYDFALYMSEKTGRNEEVTQEDRDNYQILYEGMLAIFEEFSEIRSEIELGNYSLGKTGSILSKTLNLPQSPQFDSGLADFSQQITDMAVIEYDGQFSEHIENRVPLYLEGKEEVTQEEALELAAKFLGVEVDSLSYNGMSEGSITAYEIVGDNSTIRITKQGGEALYYKKYNETTTANHSYETALEKAKETLKEAGYEDIAETHYVINDNICTINFASVQEDVIMYPDLITISVELDKGEMVEFFSEGYLMNHKEREDLVPALDENTASQSVSKDLKIENIDVAIIPSSGKNEVLCYEFICLDEDDRAILVYINGENGLEENIFIVNRTEFGSIVE